MSSLSKIYFSYIQPFHWWSSYLSRPPWCYSATALSPASSYRPPNFTDSCFWTLVTASLSSDPIALLISFRNVLMSMVTQGLLFGKQWTALTRTEVSTQNQSISVLTVWHEENIPIGALRSVLLRGKCLLIQAPHSFDGGRLTYHQWSAAGRKVDQAVVRSFKCGESYSSLGIQVSHLVVLWSYVVHGDRREIQLVSPCSVSVVWTQRSFLVSSFLLCVLILISAGMSGAYHHTVQCSDPNWRLKDSFKEGIGSWMHSAHGLPQANEAADTTTLVNTNSSNRCLTFTYPIKARRFL